MDDILKNDIRKFALQNAFEHDGKTQDKIVLSKILGTKPEYRSKAKEIISEISEIVNEINKLSLEEQKSEIESSFPDILEPKEKQVKEEQELPSLEGAENGKVVTRFPPEPNGYPHIGHAKAAIINEEYVNKYGGKKILRMDDTNPESERLEYYAAIKVGLEWLGIHYDVIKNTSDDMELLYEKGSEIINSEHAYVCTCKRDDISKNRREMKECKCSKGDLKQNNDRWNKMFEKFKPGDAIVRFRGNMNSENTVMRDPVLFRIIEGKHPLLGEKYRVWPSYDFAVAIEDSIDGVTHAFRSKEYELRNELYDAILDALKMRKPKMGEFSRLEFKGMPVSKRVLRPLIEEGKIASYDDPRLPTLEAMKKRGITPQAIRKFILSLGFTKSDTFAPFDALESFNRKIIDGESIRLFMIQNPKKIIIKKLPLDSVEIPNHPTKDLGKRRVDVEENVLVEVQPENNLEVNSHLRLMGLGNIKIVSNHQEIVAEYTDDNMEVDFPKAQWIPEKNVHKIKILIPKQLFIEEIFNENSLEELEVYTESHFLELKEDAKIQFMRFGYCRKDSQNQAIFTHK